jgi:hypothetical protein
LTLRSDATATLIDPLPFGSAIEAIRWQIAASTAVFRMPLGKSANLYIKAVRTSLDQQSYFDSFKMIQRETKQITT